jgi:hypothetical protein
VKSGIDATKDRSEKCGSPAHCALPAQVKSELTIPLLTSQASASHGYFYLLLLAIWHAMLAT